MARTGLKMDPERNSRRWQRGLGSGKARWSLICLWALLPLLLVPDVQAGPPDLEEVISRIQATYDGIQDLSARFHQISSLKSSGGKEESSGLLLMKRPGRMRWEYKSPESRLIVSDGKVLYLYTPADRQVMVQEVSQAFSSSAINLLTGMGRLREDFQIQWGKAEEKVRKGNLLLELKPIKSQGQFEQILLEVHPETFMVDRMVLKDAYANITTLGFKKVKTNTGLDDSVFTFVPPPGTEVIKGFPGTKRP